MRGCHDNEVKTCALTFTRGVISIPSLGPSCPRLLAKRIIYTFHVFRETGQGAGIGEGRGAGKNLRVTNQSLLHLYFRYFFSKGGRLLG